MVNANNNPSASTLTALTDRLPAEILGWKKSAAGDIYNPDNLFEYINGGAELYISYDFKHLVARTYKKEGFDDIKIDIFDMGNSYNAFGVFCHSREAVDRFVAPDVESEYAAGLLTFWKGRYYVSILAYPETAEKKNIVQTAARSLARRIKEESSKPPLVELLPQENLDSRSIRYFRHYIWLNSHYFVSHKNILNMDKSTEAVLARYKLGGEGKYASVLLFVTYPDPAKAENAYRSFSSQFLTDAEGGFKQMEDRRWTGAVKDRNRVSIVFNAPTLQEAKAFLAKIR
jgi:hypothetical protein